MPWSMKDFPLDPDTPEEIIVVAIQDDVLISRNHRGEAGQPSEELSQGYYKPSLKVQSLAHLVLALFQGSQGILMTDDPEVTLVHEFCYQTGVVIVVMGEQYVANIG